MYSKIFLVFAEKTEGNIEIEMWIMFYVISVFYIKKIQVN